MATTSRYSGLPNADNTSRIEKHDYQTPAFASSIALVVKGCNAKTLVQPATLIGAVTFSVNVTDPLSGDASEGPFVGDEIELFLVSDGTSRVATFGTGFLPTGTFSVTTAKFAHIAFRFNGTGWLEAGRSVSA